MRPSTEAPKTLGKTAGYFGEVEAVPGAVSGTVAGTPASAGGRTPRRQPILLVEAPPHVAASILKRSLYSDCSIF